MGHVQRVLLNLIASQLQGEALQTYHRMFREIDVDNDGSVTEEEFVPAMVARGMERHQASDLFHAADIHSNGALDFNEFVGIVFDPNALDKKTLQRHVLSIFHKIDTSGTNYISFDEFCQVFGTTTPRPVLLEIFKEIDDNGSGRINSR